MSYGQDAVAEPEDKVKLKLGGALRYNYNYSTWKPSQRRRGGDLGFEVFRINADVEYKKWKVKIDQRFYSQGFGGAFLKYGWVQYQASKRSHIKFGLIPAYFGAQQFNSHSWFFALPFYLGFEDDHDMGISYNYKDERFDWDIGYYKNAEDLSFSDNGPVSDSRYNYDFSGRNKEVHQANLRFNYKFGENGMHKAGFSLQFGGIWNLDTERMGNHRAAGVHYELSHSRWSVKTQLLTYDNRPKNANGDRSMIEMTAYGAPYNTAARANLYSIAVGYTIPVKWGPITALQFYNDYCFMDKYEDQWEDTQMNVTGIYVSAKPVYLYIDYAQGLHQPWLGPQWTNALSTGNENNGWEARFNINFGIYY